MSSGSSTIIRNSIFRGNSVHSSTHGGAGVRVSGGGPTLEVSDTTFIANTASAHADQKGAAVFIAAGSTATFLRTNFTENIAGTGGGIYNEGECLNVKGILRI